MSVIRRNLELKARYPNLDSAREVLLRLGAPFDHMEIQTDTYFCVHSGRLKLREIEGQTAQLIWYDRPDQHDSRISAYYLVPVPDAALLKTVLAAALGVRGEVRKHRAIHFWHNVRVHLDQVASLGSFVEFEAVLSAHESETTSKGRLDQLSRALAIPPSDYLAPSYADLLGL
jgi:predicted adenylyl cyclase CyaB